MYIQSLRTILPVNSKLKVSESTLVIALNALAILAVLFLPLKTALLLILLAVISLIAVFFKINIYQIFLLTLILSLIIADDYTMVSRTFFYMLFAFLTFYYFTDLCLTNKFYNKVEGHHIVAGLFLLTGFLGILSSIYNARYSGQDIFEIARLFSYAVLFLIFHFFLKDEKNINKLIITFIVTSVVIAIYSYGLVYSIGLANFIISGITSLRVMHYGFGNPGAVASVIGYSLPLLLSYVMFGKNPLYKRYSIICFLLIIIVWVLFNSRAAYVFLFISTLVLVGFHKNRFKYYTTISIFMLGLLILFITAPFFKDLLRLEAGLSGRNYLWQAAVKIIEQNPILGLGPGSYAEVKFFYLEPGIAKAVAGLAKMTTHNLILYRSAELGIGAGIILLVYWTFVINYFYKNVKKLKNSDYYYLYLGCGAIFIGQIFKFIFEASASVLPIFFVPFIFRLPKLNDFKH